MTSVQTLSSMNYLNELGTRSSLRAVVEKLSEHVRNRWRKRNFDIKSRKRIPNLDDIISFVDRVVDEESDPVFGNLQKSTLRQPRDKCFDFKQQRRRNAAFSSDAKAKPIERTHERAIIGGSISKYVPKCPMCEDTHYLNQCDRFRELAVKDRHSFVLMKKLCVNCFQAGHFGRDCQKKWTCNVPGCGQRHNRWLHLPNHQTATDTLAAKPVTTRGSTFPANNQPVGTIKSRPNMDVRCAFAGAGQGTIGMPIIPVTIQDLGRRKQTETYALLDRCSNSTVCTDRLRTKLNVLGRPGIMELTTLHRDHVEEEVMVVDLEVGALNSGKTFRLTDVISREKLNVSLDNRVTSSDIGHMLHLRDVTLLNVDVSQVDLIIGSDHAQLLIDLESRSGKEGEPIATRTLLGWAMFGPTKKFTPKKASTYFVNSTLSLEKQVERYWKLDDPLYKEETALSVSNRKIYF
ncbi:PREDICTED: uncharacterized protein LOC106816617 [Priapulus caudatus]|uniref:Uncharacterized protein LOC106816617 n=1 Tax=Priapulus caudatus TaxID=37621 RepID=A0ABM1EX04_PRICU|nr:PREDICTED: uncharacterized protein LOC106816617 [Priapulus caudatus]